MKIKKENVLAAYKTAREAGADSTCKVLEDLFGKEVFKPKDVMERVKTFEDACSELGIEADKWLQDKEDLGFEPDVIAYLKLRIIAAALNEGWKPKFNGEEYRYFPWFYIYTKDELDAMSEDERRRVVGRAFGNASAGGGLVCASAYGASSYSSADSGSRLAFKSEELAVYCGKQFIDIWADYVC